LGFSLYRLRARPPATTIPATGDTDTVTIGSDPYTGGATQEDYDQMQSIPQGIEDLKQSHDAAPDGVSPDDSTEADDSSGH
jgi:hypothetical protein